MQICQPFWRSGDDVYIASFGLHCLSLKNTDPVRASKLEMVRHCMIYDFAPAESGVVYALNVEDEEIVLIDLASKKELKDRRIRRLPKDAKSMCPLGDGRLLVATGLVSASGDPELWEMDVEDERYVEVDLSSLPKELQPQMICEVRLLYSQGRYYIFDLFDGMLQQVLPHTWAVEKVHVFDQDSVVGYADNGLVILQKKKGNTLEWLVDSDFNIRLCGEYPSPTPHDWFGVAKCGTLLLAKNAESTESLFYIRENETRWNVLELS